MLQDTAIRIATTIDRIEAAFTDGKETVLEGLDPLSRLNADAPEVEAYELGCDLGYLIMRQKQAEMSIGEDY
jgi:hypothetical protein